MHYSNIIYSKVLDHHRSTLMLDQLVKHLVENDIQQVQIIFGWNWIDEYKDRVSHNVRVHDLIKEVNKAEHLGLGQLGSDDVSINLPGMETIILFCHDGDIHLSFNKTNELVNSIISGWEAEQVIHTAYKSKH